MGDENDKRTHNVRHDSSVSVFNTDCNGMRHSSKTKGVRERWILDIYYQIHPLVCDSADYFFWSITEKTSAQRFEIKTEDM